MIKNAQKPGRVFKMGKLRKIIKSLGIIGDIEKLKEIPLYSLERLRKGKTAKILVGRPSPAIEKQIELKTISRRETQHGPEGMGRAPQVMSFRKTPSIERARKYIAGERTGIFGKAFSEQEKEHGVVYLGSRVIPDWMHQLISKGTTRISTPLGFQKFRYEKRQEAARKYLKKKGKS